MQAGSLCCANARGCMDCVEPRHAPGCPYPFHGVCGCGSFDAADNVPQWNQQTMSPCPPLQCEPVTDNVGISMEDVSRRTIPRSYMIRPTSFHPPPEQLPMSNSYTHINPLLDAAERGDPVPTVIGSQRAIERAQTVTSRPNPYPDLTATFPRTSQAGQRFRASNYRMCHPDMTGWGPQHTLGMFRTSKSYVRCAASRQDWSTCQSPTVVGGHLWLTLTTDPG